MRRIIIIFLLFLTQFEIVNAQGFRYGIILGLNQEDHFSSRTVTHDYFYMQVGDPRVRKTRLKAGIFAEYQLPKFQRWSINSQLTTWGRALQVAVTDTHPDLGFDTHTNLVHIGYQIIAWNIQPSFRLNKYLKVSGGYELHLSYRFDEYGYDGWKVNDPNPDWIYQRMYTMLDRAKYLDMNPFIHNFFAAVELNYWRLGLEYKIGRAVGNTVGSVYHENYVFNTNHFLSNHFLSLKVYLN